jgi:hypothetical protein
MSEYKCESKLATRPLLWSDTLGGKQVYRDDLWAITTEELNKLEAENAALQAQLSQAKAEAANERSSDNSSGKLDYE